VKEETQPALGESPVVGPSDGGSIPPASTRKLADIPAGKSGYPFLFFRRTFLDLQVAEDLLD